MNNCLLCKLPFNSSIDFNFLFSFNKLWRSYVCDRCFNLYKKLSDHPTCSQCSKILNNSGCCSDCQNWQDLFQEDVVINNSLFRYESYLKEYFRSYKMYGDYRLRNLFKKQIAQYLNKQKYDAYIFVPSSLAHIKKRKFDPVKGLYEDIIQPTVRVKNILDVKHQSQKNRQERMKTEQTFFLSDEATAKLSKARSILILDDIYTTGATIYRIRKLIRSNGLTARLNSFTLGR